MFGLVKSLQNQERKPLYTAGVVKSHSGFLEVHVSHLNVESERILQLIRTVAGKVQPRKLHADANN